MHFEPTLPETPDELLYLIEIKPLQSINFIHNESEAFVLPGIDLGQ